MKIVYTTTKEITGTQLTVSKALFYSENQKATINDLKRILPLSSRGAILRAIQELEIKGVVSNVDKLKTSNVYQLNKENVII